MSFRYHSGKRSQQLSSGRLFLNSGGELERAGGRASEPDALTPTESRVAQLAASGLANKEIAEQAFLTTKAVEANLTRVYRKLGIRSRGGLARALQATADIAASDD